MRGSRAAAATVLAVLVALGGCSLLGGGPVEATASPASVCPGALSSTGYVTDVSQWANRSREVSVAGNTRTLRLSSYVNGYVREGPDDTEGGFALLATPRAAVAGRALNPVGEQSARDLAGALATQLDQYGQLRDLERVGTEQVTVLGVETTRTRFGAVGTDGDGDPVDVYVSVARVSHGGDFVVAGSVHEQGSGERARLDRLFGCVEHADREPTDDGTPLPTDAPTDERVITGFHPPQVDGVLYGHTGQSLPEGKAAEWADGARRSVRLRSADGERTLEATLYTKEVGDSVYLGLQVPPDALGAEVGRASLQFDRDRDGSLSAGDVRLLRVPTDDGPVVRLQEFRDGAFRTVAVDGEGGQPGSVALAGDGESGLVLEAELDTAAVERNLGAIDLEGEATGIWAGLEIEGETYGVGDGDISDRLAGTRYLDYRRIRLPRLPTDDLAVERIIVTQSVQTGSNSLRLVREKETLARVFVTHDNADATEVTVRLQGYDTSGSGYRSLGTVTETFEAPPGTPDVGDGDDSANIELPATWTDVDDLAVTARVYRLGYLEDTPNDNLRRTTVDLVETFDPTIYYVRANVGSSASPSRSSTANVDVATTAMADAYPVADPTFVELPGTLADDFGGESTSERINDMNGIAAGVALASAIDSSVEPPSQVFGFTPDFAGISDPAWDSGASFVAIGGVDPSAHRELIMAHEINHNLGDDDWGKHAGNGSAVSFANGCGAGADADWSRINPTNTYVQEVGWDPSVGVVPDEYPEFESYCQIWEVRSTVPGWTGEDPPQWISDYRWSRLLNLFAGWDGNPAHPNLRDDGGSGAAETAADRANGRKLLGREVPTARVVSGTLFRDGGGELRPTFEQPGRVPDRLDRPPVADPHSVLVVRYADGSELEVPLRARFEGGLEEYGDSPRRPFSVAVDDNRTVTGIELVDARSGEVVDRLGSTDYTAEVSFGLPGEFARDQPTPIEARVESAAETTLYRQLLYTPDGEAFYPFSGVTTDGKFRADFRGLPGGEDARFVLLVSDGVRTTFAASRPVSVPPAPPTVDIRRNQRYVVTGEPPQGEASRQSLDDAAAPGGERVGDQSLEVRQVREPVRTTVGETVSLAVSSRDQWGRDLPPSALSWRAVDGNGRTATARTGTPFTHRFTRPGTYEVTVTGTARSGLTDTDTIRVVVTAPSLPDAATVERFAEARAAADR